MSTKEEIESLLKRLDTDKVEVFNKLLDYILKSSSKDKESQIGGYKFSIVYYLREVENLSWYKIKRLFKELNIDIEFNYRSLSKQINRFNKETTNKITGMLLSYGKQN